MPDCLASGTPRMMGCHTWTMGGMERLPSSLDAIQAVCRRVARATSLEALYEGLVPWVEEACETATGGFLTFAEHGVVPPAMQVLQGTGRFAALAGTVLHDEEVAARLAECLRTGSNVFGADFAAFPFPHPKNFSLLVYVELPAPVEAVRQRLLSFLNDQVTSSISALSHAKHADRTNRATVIALASLAEHKDRDTGEHILRVARMTDEIVQVLVSHGRYREQITPEFRQFISTASILHDVGKVAIPDGILQKPGRLDADERTQIESHTVRGRRVLEKASRILEGNNYLLELAADVALYHHERFDGQGYPEGLAGEDIPLSARIVGLADVYDALSSKRPYKDAWSEEETVRYIADGAGKQFDPVLVEAFLNVMAYRREAALVQWTPQMSVGEEGLDEDHRFLIALNNQLAPAARICNRRGVESVLDELVNYTIEHFQREEAYMQETDYSAMPTHMLQHAAFTETILDIRWQYLHGLRPYINGDVLRFLRDWLSKHIVVEDKKYAQAARREPVAEKVSS